MPIGNIFLQTRYEFSERELSAWQTMLKVVGATNITPWTHEESQVGSHTIAKSCKYARINGYEASSLVKPIIHRQRFTPEMLKQIDTFLNDKEFVNISSYKTDAKTGKPIKYL
ncbi:hypothetical protein GLOIN_2v1785706 [Rhizophagus clarus]|uniref:Uncharacterized protein n=1 Tax=Rhizophagus clarus TaxID=94130 RepID=A0A8H3M7P5_9GLOM|nr:hypothetical protein GLOIN_2v1785706 [Rhizophagus clarus]